MRKISFWARDNKWSTRFIIIGIYVLLNVLGIASGWLLKDLQISIPHTVFLFIIFLFLIGVLAYPLKENKKHESSFYIWQKTCDLILAFSSFCMIVYAGNNYNNLFNNNSTANAAVNSVSSLHGDSITRSYQSIASFNKTLKDENGKSLQWKEKKKLLKKQVKEIKAAKDISQGGKIVLIFLSVLVALGLLFLLAALSCSIACNASGGLAVVVAVLGTTGIIILLAFVIRAITGKEKKKKPTIVEEPPIKSS